ncbi:PREDICTED: taste receptor type 2 member 1-like [Nanorana parkeri]|uniref:taste receptor type 2 member 1-like n=1 Tax=Nanorana parkeri TaxID=125878 RepID=UPI000854275F|nr:PREDICTED: taste receptor type 2 member 1-like [Nanorana parkeri]
MELSSNITEIIACCILIFTSLLGNAILIYGTWRCITRRLPTSFALIFSLAFAHVLKNIVVNAINIIFSVGFPPNPVICKIRIFTASMTTKLEIWFTLYIAIFYCVKLHRVIHPLRAPPNSKWRKHHLLAVFALWVTSISVCCPYLVFVHDMQSLTSFNDSYTVHHSFLYEDCDVRFPDAITDLCYHQIFMVVTDLLPIVVLLFVCGRILLLFREHNQATYGNIWIGHDASETEVLRASKVIVFLMHIVTALWVAHFVIVRSIAHVNLWYWMSTLLIVLFSGYASISPYLLMLINYRISLQIRSLSSFCCKKSNMNKSPSGGQKAIPDSSPAED